MSKPLLFALFLFLVIKGPISTWGDELDHFLEEIGDTQTQEDLSFMEGKMGLDFKAVDSLWKQEKKLIKRESIELPPPPPLQKSRPPRKFPALLKEGAYLTDIKTDKVFKNTHHLYVYAQEKIEGGPLSYILDTQGNIRYHTRTSNLVDIENDVKLYPSMNPLKVYLEKTSFHLSDKSLPLGHFFKFKLGGMGTDYHSLLFQDRPRQALTYTFQLKNYYHSSSPINFGLDLQYSASEWQSNQGKITWAALFLGPTAYAHFWRSAQTSWYLHLGAGQSLLHHTQRGLHQHQYSSLSLQLDIDKVYHTDYGQWTIGGGIRWLQSSALESSEFINNQSSKGDSLSIQLAVGHLYNWHL